MVELRYVGANGVEQVIPTEEELIETLKAGKLKTDTLVQVQGTDQWVTAGSMQEFPIWYSKAQEVGPGSITPSTRPAVPWRWIAISIAILGILIYVAAYVTTNPRLTVERSSYLVGAIVGLLIRNLIITLVVAAIVGSLRKGSVKSNPWLTWMVFGAIVFTESTIRGGIMVTEMRSSLQALADVKQVIQPVLTGESTGGSNPQTRTGEWLQSYVQRVQTIYADIDASFHANQVESLLSPETMATAVSLERAVERSRKHEAVLANAEQRLLQLIDGLEQELATLDLPPDFKKGVINGARQTAPQSLQSIREYFAVERDTMREFIGLLEFMRRAQAEGRYTVQGGDILFSTDTDLQGYNSYLQRIRTLGEKEQALLALMQQKLKQLQQQSQLLSPIK